MLSWYQSLQLIYLLDLIFLLLHGRILLKMIAILLILSLNYRRKKRRYYITYNKILFLIPKYYTLTVNVFLLLEILKLHQTMGVSIHMVSLLLCLLIILIINLFLLLLCTILMDFYLNFIELFSSYQYLLLIVIMCLIFNWIETLKL